MWGPPLLSWRGPPLLLLCVARWWCCAVVPAVWVLPWRGPPLPLLCVACWWCCASALALLVGGCSSGRVCSGPAALLPAAPRGLSDPAASESGGWLLG